MSFNIDAARTAVDQNKLVFKKGDGLTHALLRVALGETAEWKEWKELQKEFKALQAEQKAAIMELASELSTDSKPFYKPVAGIKEYQVETKQYAAQSLVQPTGGSDSGVVPPPRESASVVPQGFSFEEGFPEWKKEEFKTEFAPFMNRKQIKLEGASGITVNKVEWVFANDKLWAHLILSNGERIYIGKNEKTFTIWTPGLDAQVQIGATLYDVSLKDDNTISLTKVRTLAAGERWADMLAGFVVNGNPDTQLYFTEDAIGFGEKRFALKGGYQVIRYRKDGIETDREAVVVIDMQKKTITINDSSRQKLIDALNAKQKKATLWNTPDTIKVGNFEVTLSQARVIERYDGKEVDIGNGRTEKKVKLATEIDSQQKSVKVFYKGGEDDFFVVNIAKDNTVTLSLKTPSLIPGFSLMKETSTRNQLDIKNTIQSLVTQK
jgi:hypothetical protein